MMKFSTDYHISSKVVLNALATIALSLSFVTSLPAQADIEGGTLPEVPGGQRGGICVLSPGALGNMRVWSDRPVFVWQANPDVIQPQQIRLIALPSRTSVWEKPLTATDQLVIYDGSSALQSGQYRWELTLRRWDEEEQAWKSEQESRVFAVIDMTQREQIASELSSLTTENDVNAIALDQSNYFAEQDLWSDALQVLYAVQTPSTAVTQRIQQITDHVCAADNTSESQIPAPSVDSNPVLLIAPPRGTRALLNGGMFLDVKPRFYVQKHP